MSDPTLDQLETLRLERERQTMLLTSAQQTVKDIKEMIATIDTRAWAIVEEANSPQEHLAFGDADPTDHEVAEVQRARAGRRGAKKTPKRGKSDWPLKTGGLDPSAVTWPEPDA